MPRPSSKKRNVAAKQDAAAATGIQFEFQHRAGMPSLDSVIEVRQFVPSGQANLTPISTALGNAIVVGAQYRILRTNEVDEYEADKTSGKSSAAKSGVAVSAAAAASGDSFGGNDRKAAKLSIGTGKTETFADLKDLIASLPSEKSMINHNPPIQTTSTSGRVKEEQRNVRVKAFLYAASRENDNDFHLIIGRDPKKQPELYLTMELSGLPTKNSASFKVLQAARNAYKTFFGNNLPGSGYDFYDPPIPVEIEGSPFFDMTHAKGSRPGPKSLKSRMPTIFEIHPITKITF